MGKSMRNTQVIMKIAMLVLLTAGLTTTAFAEDTLTMGTAYSSKVWSIYNIACVISLPLGAISIATAAFKMLGDEKTMEAGKKQILITVLTVAALYILPSVIKMGVDLGYQYRWNPRG